MYEAPVLVFKTSKFVYRIENLVLALLMFVVHILVLNDVWYWPMGSYVDEIDQWATLYVDKIDPVYQHTCPWRLFLMSKAKRSTECVKRL